MEQISQVSLRRSRFGGFTLIELLVVIGIIGMLVALLLPAVMSAQEQARQTQCAKQMKDLAAANLMHAMKKGHFPGWINGTPSDTWVEAILPYLDMQQLARSKDYQTNPADYVDPLFYCPSNPPEDTSALSLSYAANAGMTDSGSAEPDSTDQVSNTDSNRWTALFHDRSAANGGVSIGLDDVLDGKRSTLLLAEKVTLGDWNVADEATTGFWFDPAASPNNGAIDLNNVQNTNSAPCSFHQEGFNVAYCDGHTDFYFYEEPVNTTAPTADEINNYKKFRAKMTPAGSYYNVEYDDL